MMTNNNKLQRKDGATE